MTLRTKLIAASVALVLLASGIIAVATSLYLNHYLTDQVDSRLVAANSGGGPAGNDGDDAATCAAGSGGKGEDDHHRPGFTESLSAKVTNGSVSYAGIFVDANNCEPLTGTAATALLTISAGARPVTVNLGGLGDYRVLARSDGHGSLLITGLSLDRELATVRQLVWTMIIVTAAALLLAALVAFLIMRRALRPLERMAATARQVSTVQLHRGEVDLEIRVPDTDTDPRTEVGQVGAALNQMLGHVGAALDRRHRSETQVRQFVADASHELRTPLAAIRGYTELARRDDADPEAVTHALSRVDSESVRMSVLVDDLLLLARLDAGRPLEAAEVDLTMLVMDVVSDARVAGPQHHWRLNLPEEPISVIGDQSRLHQVLANLLTNARTHTPPGTTVTTGLATDRGQVVLTVTDDGPGIDPGLLTGIFDRFVRGDSARARGAGSTGLGLSIVQAVVRAHGGAVTAASRPGNTCFTVRLAGLVSG